MNQGVTGLIPSQGTHLGCRPGPHWGVRERQLHIDASLPLFLPIKIINKIFKRKKRRSLRPEDVSEVELEPLLGTWPRN